MAGHQADAIEFQLKRSYTFAQNPTSPLERLYIMKNGTLLNFYSKSAVSGETCVNSTISISVLTTSSP
jgi:hypothetical protein